MGQGRQIRAGKPRQTDQGKQTRAKRPGAGSGELGSGPETPATYSRREEASLARSALGWQAEQAEQAGQGRQPGWAGQS